VLSKYNIKLPLVMLFIVAAVVPTIVRLAWIPIPPEFSRIFTQDYMDDMFSYHKAWVLGVCAIGIIFHIVSEFVIKLPDPAKFKRNAAIYFKNPIIIMVGVYLFFVILSNILSPYTYTALWGIYDRREGLFVQLAYMTIFLATMHYVQQKTDTHILLVGFLISSIIMGGIGFSQFINRDFFATEFAAQLVVGRGSPALNPRFDFAYGTNFNPNTFGLVTAMLFPLLFAAAASYSAGDKRLTYLWRGLFLLAGGLMAIGVVGSRSVGGFIGASTALSAIVTTLLVRRILLKGQFPRKVLVPLAVGLALIVGTGFVLRDYIYENLAFTLGRIAAIFEPPDMSHLPDFTFHDNVMTTTERGHSYTMTFPTYFPREGLTEEQFALMPPEFTTAEGTVIEPHIEGNSFTYYMPGFGTVRVDQVADAVYIYRGFSLSIVDERLHLFYFREDRHVDPNEPIPSWGFEGWETWGSNRGHIFARTIPLLPESIIIGSGSDTFLLRFPTHDILSNLRYHQNPFILVDKAHNLYLQTWLTTGMISVLALIGIFGYYILTTFWSLIRYSKDEDSSTFWLRLGILASVSAFSVSSLSTDSTLSSTPMFWIIIGMGLALNREVNNGRRTN